MINLKELKENIEKMPKYHQIEVLRILSNCNEVCLNENNNGTFVNLTEQSSEVIEKLENYSKYVDEQQQELSMIEEEKEKLEKTFFKDNKEISNVIIE